MSLIFGLCYTRIRFSPVALNHVDRHGGISWLKAFSSVEEGHEGFLTGRDGQHGQLCGTSGKGGRMSFIRFIMALFGIGSNQGAGLDPNG